MAVTAWPPKLGPATWSHDPGDFHTTRRRNTHPVSAGLSGNGLARRGLRRGSASSGQRPQFIDGESAIVDADIVDEAMKEPSLDLCIRTDEHGEIVDADIR